MDCQMVELAKSENVILTLVDLNNDHSYTDENTTYYYEVDNEEASLKSIIVKGRNHKLEMGFIQPLPIEKKEDGDTYGKFYVMADPAMGTVEGIYKWRQENGISTINLSPDKGWKPVPNSRITKMILSNKSVFCNWPKSYNYMQEIQKKQLNI